MKKQINPTIKAHLIRSAFYLLLLLAVCAIPFALAQRNATKRPVTKVAAKLLTPLSALKPPQAAPPASGAAQATKLSGVHSKGLHSLTLACGFFPMTFAVFRTCRVRRRFLRQPVALVLRTYSRFRERRKLRR